MRAELPTIYITARDVVRLDRLARFHARRDNPAGKRLAAELRRAVICQPEEIAPDAVTMLSRIQYRLDSSAQPDERCNPRGRCAPSSPSRDGFLSDRAVPFRSGRRGSR